MEDRWTVYIRENAKKRNIPNPWLKSKQSQNEKTRKKSWREVVLFFNESVSP